MGLVLRIAHRPLDDKLVPIGGRVNRAPERAYENCEFVRREEGRPCPRLSSVTTGEILHLTTCARRQFGKLFCRGKTTTGAGPRIQYAETPFAVGTCARRRVRHGHPPRNPVPRMSALSSQITARGALPAAAGGRPLPLLGLWKPRFREHPHVDHRRLVGGTRDQLSEGQTRVADAMTAM